MINSRTVSLASVGCRTNQEEIAVIGHRLAERGYRLVRRVEDAEVVVVNTCAVTAHAEAKTRRLLQSIARRSPKAKIMVTGCLAQQQPEKLHRMACVEWVVGNAFKLDAAALVETGAGSVLHAPVDATAELKVAGCGCLESGLPARTRYSVKIQEGCGRACAFCIVPALRGPSRSAPMGEVAAACESALRAGFKEIVLTGTHIGQYSDPGSGAGLADLLEKLCAFDTYDFRIRLSSLNPGDITERLCGLFARHPRMCDHIHVSVQSLCPEVVTSMGRSAGEMERCIERLRTLRSRRPHLALGADIIVGFPGETQTMFETTLSRLEEIELSYAHVFRYSRRPGTVAAGMHEQVAEAEKTRRSTLMRQAAARSRRRFIERQYGVMHTVLVEKSTPASGLTSNYIRVEIGGACVPENVWIEAEIGGYDAVRNRCRALSWHIRAAQHG